MTVIADNDWPALVPGLPPGNGITRPRAAQDPAGRRARVRRGRAHRRDHRRRCEDTGERVDVDFTDGAGRTYDLVVGADGLYSQIRELVFGTELKAEYTGQVCWRYNLPRIEGLDKIWVFIGATRTRRASSRSRRT